MPRLDDDTIGRKRLAALPAALPRICHTRVERIVQHATRGRRALRTLVADARGAQMVEYTVIIGGVAMVCMVVFVSLGVAIAQSFAFSRSSLFYPYP